MKHKTLKSRKNAKDLDKYTIKRLSKPDSVGRFIIGTILLSSVLSIFAFYPVSLHITPYIYSDSNRYIDMDNLRPKNIVGMQMLGTPRLGFNSLEVIWPVWSDCGPAYVVTIQYNMLGKEIHIGIWGRSIMCPQIVAYDDHRIEIFIPFPGLWQIYCNGRLFIVFI